MKKSVTITLAVILYSCSVSYMQEMEEVLQKAGKNRSELEAVLIHYSHDAADSLKLRAAEFPIINMPGKKSEYFDAPWNDVASVFLRWTSSSDIQKVIDAYNLGDLMLNIIETNY
jgi:hypothetical protein